MALQWQAPHVLTDSVQGGREEVDLHSCMDAQQAQCRGHQCMKDMLLLSAGLCGFRAHRKRHQQGCAVQDVQAL